MPIAQAKTAIHCHTQGDRVKVGMLVDHFKVISHGAGLLDGVVNRKNPAGDKLLRVEFVEVVHLPSLSASRNTKSNGPSSFTTSICVLPLMRVTRCDNPASLTCLRARSYRSLSISIVVNRPTVSSSASPIQIAENPCEVPSSRTFLAWLPSPGNEETLRLCGGRSKTGSPWRPSDPAAA